MLNRDRATAGELRDSCLRRARILERASRRQAAVGDSTGALLFVWAADLSMVQAVLLERIVLDARAAQRQYFSVAEQVSAALARVRAVDSAQASSASVLGALRDTLYAAVEPGVARDIAGRVADSGYLAGLPAPADADVADVAGRRLQGLSATDFVARRRREAAELMVSAQTHRMHEHSAQAIQAAYDSDFRSLEAYLVESAVAAGDTWLLSVDVRWELAIQSMSEVPGLPADFTAGVAAIRDALGRGLGEPDATRLREVLPPV